MGLCSDYLVFLFRPPNLVIQLSMVQCQPTVDSKCFEWLLVLLKQHSQNPQRSGSKAIHTFVKTSPSPFLLTICTTPMTVPLIQIGMHRIDLVVYPVWKILICKKKPILKLCPPVHQYWGWTCHPCRHQFGSKDDQIDHVRRDHIEFYEGMMEFTARMKKLEFIH